MPGMRPLTSLFSALLALSAAANGAASLFTDDVACSFSTATRRCEPVEFCAFQFRFGDLTFSQACRADVSVVGRVPQQIHLAFAGEEPGTAMTISWATFSLLEAPQVWLAGSSDEVEASPVAGDQLTLVVDSYSDNDGDSTSNDAGYSLYSYHATVSGLQPQTEYFYQVGSDSSRSNVSSFVTARSPLESTDEGANSGDSDAAASSFEVLIYGDFGADANAEATRAYLGNLSRPIDFVFHIGDVSYADNAWLSLSTLLGDFYEELYNQWMDTLAPVLANVPYMVLVGNHEAECHSPSCFFAPESVQRRWSNYSAFNSRFRMPSNESGGARNMWYSFDHGPVHFVALSTETDFANAPRNTFLEGDEFSDYGHFGDQLSWLESDLKAANASREATPWIVVGMHRAMYTLLASDADGKPTGTSAALQAAFEELFIKYAVDVVVAGHVHAYERHYPIARGEIVGDGVSADGSVYASPKAPVYIVTGAAGNGEGHDSEASNATTVAWNAVSDCKHYAISSLTVNRTALAFSLIGTEESSSGTVLDAFIITKP